MPRLGPDSFHRRRLKRACGCLRPHNEEAIYQDKVVEGVESAALGFGIEPVLQVDSALLILIEKETRWREVAYDGQAPVLVQEQTKVSIVDRSSTQLRAWVYRPTMSPAALCLTRHAVVLQEPISEGKHHVFGWHYETVCSKGDTLDSHFDSLRSAPRH